MKILLILALLVGLVGVAEAQVISITCTADTTIVIAGTIRQLECDQDGPGNVRIRNNATAGASPDSAVGHLSWPLRADKPRIFWFDQSRGYNHIHVNLGGGTTYIDLTIN